MINEKRMKVVLFYKHTNKIINKANEDDNIDFVEKLFHYFSDTFHYPI